MPATALEPAADKFADLVNRFRGEPVTVHLEALQILGEPHLEAEDFQHEVGLLQQFLAWLAVLYPYQRLQQVVEVSLNAFTEDKAVIARELAGVVTGPEDKVVGLRDDH